VNDRTHSKIIASTLRHWWKALQPKEMQDGRQGSPFGLFENLLGRADRARLRRARTSTELLLDPATILLNDRLLPAYAARVHAATRDDPTLHVGIALTAGILSHVTTDTGEHQPSKSLAARLGEKTGDRRLMSELRFRNLQATRTPEELLLQSIRAVAIAGSKADVGALGADLLRWFHEIERPPHQPALSVRYRWAHDYYLANDKKLVADKTSSETIQDA